MKRRDFIRLAGAMPLLLPGSGCSLLRTPSAPRIAYNGKDAIRIDGLGLARPVRMVFAGDTHFGLHDARDDAYAGHYARMAQYGAKKEPFEKMLAALTADRPDALVLLGDNISFPTLANVEYFHGQLEKSGLDFLYTAGNHDWHFEGDGGSDLEQRARWIERRLKPLYRGRNPLMYSRTIGGIRVVMIDNSAYHVTPEQLAFWQDEAATGDPLILAMHIPFWQPGSGVTTCACPTWGAATDPYWEIERRQRWSEKLSPSTYAFREAVFSTPNLVAVMAGHVHRFTCARDHGHQQFTVPANSRGATLAVTFA